MGMDVAAGRAGGFAFQSKDLLESEPEQLEASLKSIEPYRWEFKKQVTYNSGL